MNGERRGWMEQREEDGEEGVWVVKRKRDRRREGEDGEVGVWLVKREGNRKREKKDGAE